MKKVLVLCVTLLMVLAMSVPAFAAPGRFVSSPSGVGAPELIDFSNKTSGCTAELKITAYADRYTLDDASRAKLEKAYSEIVNAADVTDLNADLADLAKTMKIDSGKLAVSDLFDISYYNCTAHEGHSGFLITIKPETLENFVGLLHFNGNSWELVKDAKVDGGNLVFTVDDLSPFAIVVNTSTDSPVTGDASNIGLYVALMAVSAAALIVIAFKLKKKETN